MCFLTETSASQTKPRWKMWPQWNDPSVSLYLLFSFAVTVTATHLESQTSVQVLHDQTLILPCNTTLLISGTFEWQWKHDELKRQVIVVRDGEDLFKEKHSHYAGRSSATVDGTLKLLGMTQRDTGDYSCLRRFGVAEMVVHVTVCESSVVDMGVRRSAENHLLVTCTSTGWIRGTKISLLNSQGGILTGEIKEVIEPDGCRSLSTSLNLTQASFRNGTINCTVVSPDSTVVKTNQITLTDEKQLDEPPASHIITFMNMQFFFLGIIIWAAVVWVQRRCSSAMQKLFSGLRQDTVDEERQRLMERIQSVDEDYFDICDIPTSGASEATAKMKGLMRDGKPRSGVEVSEDLAAQDFDEMLRYKDDILQVGRNLHVAPGLIAGIISRQSNAGTQLRPDGYGLSDKDCYGLMQVNRRYQAVSVEARGQDHIRQGVTFLIQLLKTMCRERPTWNKEQLLKGALASYISGEENVLALNPNEDVDKLTPCGDFANDVIARGHYYTRRGFGAFPI